MDTNLYSIGAFFHDRHPELVDDGRRRRPRRSSATASRRYARGRRAQLETAFQTLVTGLAVRYYRAVNG